MSENTLRSLGTVLEILLDGVFICAIALIVIKAALYVFRTGRITWLIRSFRIIQIIFFISYFLLVGIFLIHVLFSSQTWEDVFRNSFIALMVLFLGFMFWIGPINGIFGIKFRKKHDYIELQDKNVSKDGWIIESWTGEEHEQLSNIKKKDHSGF